MARREYVVTMQLTRDQVHKMSRFNANIRRYGLDSYDQSGFQNAVTAISTILSLVSVGISATPVAITGAVFAMISASSSNEKDTLERVLLNGEDGLNDIVDLCDSNPSWQMVELQLPMLEFVDEGFRVVQGEPVLKRVKVNGGWQS